LVDLCIRRGVDFHQVDESTGIDLDTSATLAARLGRDAVGLAVERLGEDARERGLSNSARPGEQIRVVQALRIEGIRERRYDVRLSDDLLENLRTPFAGENLRRHRRKKR